VRDHLLQIVGRAPPDRRHLLAREYMQIYLLRLMHEGGAFPHLAFLGGTALRLLFSLPRFSEDLDFSCAPGGKSTGGSFSAVRLFQELKGPLRKGGYDVSIRERSERNVANAFVRFEGLPQLVGYSVDPRLALTVKIEIDTNPPAGAGVETTLVQRFFPLALRHYDLPSLFAGKLHALLARPYTKGRDWFDLAWYLTEKRGIEPNVELLRNALRQTGHPEGWADAWRRELAGRLDVLDWASVERDLEPLLERSADLEHIRPEGIRGLLG
jgi:predicted nucleotidyltransferase component of viral defense system